MSNHRGWLRTPVLWLLSIVAIGVACVSGVVGAADSGFNIQVSPSPLIVTLTPGQRHTAVVTVRNLSNHSETLTPKLQGFALAERGDKIDFTATVPAGLEQWMRFGQSSLTIPPGGTQPLEIVYDTPSNVGFSYSVAIMLTSTTKPAQTQGTGIQPSVAVFNLINISRPDAKRQLSIEAFAANRSRYSFLPASFELTIRNRGNVIDQPSGTIFIQRSPDDTEPIATIPLNKAGRYLLPDSTRTLIANWDSGFPRYIQDGTGQRLSWDWRHLNQLRFGKYVAKVVLVYNDGQRDMPLTASYSFWVIPWTLILGVVVVVGLLVTGIVAWIRLVLKGTKKVKSYARRGK